MLALAAGDGTDDWETAGACIDAAREMLGMVLMGDGVLRIEMAAQWPRPLGLVETAGGTDSLDGWYVIVVDSDDAAYFCSRHCQMS